MSTSLVQLLGGLVGLAIAYSMHYFDQRRLDRIDAELEEKHQQEIAAIRQQALKR
jgi:hypothetical protein